MYTFLSSSQFNDTIAHLHIEAETNGRHFEDDIFKWIFLNESVWITIKISLKFVPKGPINKIPSLVQIMAWRRPGDKPLSEPMMVDLPTHICVSQPQWVNTGVFHMYVTGVCSLTGDFGLCILRNHWKYMKYVAIKVKR